MDKGRKRQRESFVGKRSGKAGTRRASNAINAVRAFPPPIAIALAEASLDYDPESPTGDESLRMAVLAAATQARAQGWRAEELLAALSAAIANPERQSSLGAGLADVVRRRALIAFFGGHERS